MAQQQLVYLEQDGKKGFNMALIVENGTIVAGAESYISVADADTYFTNRGNGTWAALTTQVKEQLLRKSTDYLVQVYRIKWNGYRVSAEQTLDWPRNFVIREDFQAAQLNGFQMIGGNYYYPNNIVPTEIKTACAEMAVKAYNGDLAPDLSRKTKREKVDSLEVEYSDYGVEYVRYRAIDNLLSPFINSGESGAIRAVLR